MVLGNPYLAIRVCIIVQATASAFRSFNPSRITPFDSLSTITKTFIYPLLSERSVIKSMDTSCHTLFDTDSSFSNPFFYSLQAFIQPQISQFQTNQCTSCDILGQKYFLLTTVYIPSYPGWPVIVESWACYIMFIWRDSLLGTHLLPQNLIKFWVSNLYSDTETLSCKYDGNFWHPYFKYSVAFWQAWSSSHANFHTLLSLYK